MNTLKSSLSIKLLLQHRIKIAFSIALVSLLSVGITSYIFLNTFNENNQWVQHTHNVLQTCDQFLLGVARIEGSSRRFILTGDESDADTFRADVSSAKQHEAAIRYLTADNPAQQQRLSALEALVIQRIQFAEMAMQLRRTQGIQAAADEIGRGQAQLIMAQIQTLVSQIQDNEKQLLELRNTNATRLLKLNKTVLILGSFLGLLLTGAALWDVLRDNAKRRRAERALFKEKERAQVTLDSIGDAVISTDPTESVTFLNSVAEHMTGWTREEAAGRPLSEVYRLRESRGSAAAPNLTEAAVLQDRTIPLPPDCLLLQRDGSAIVVEGCVAPIHDRGGQASGTVIISRDVSPARALALQMTHNAEHDFLTGLPNRLLLGDRITVAIASAQRRRNNFALLFLDLDNFKHINDSLGHLLGDKLLQSIAKRLVASLRGSDTVSRQGGDEFVVLLTELESPVDATLIASKILELVMGAHAIDGHDLHVTTSIGISVYPDDGQDAETLLKNADTAMYEAKENGRQCYRFFQQEMHVRAVERQSIEEGLRRALERQEFALHYQPIIDLATGSITGAEALIRWMHPTRGLVPPGQFIPVAEDCGLIVPIGAWVLREACRQTQAWVDAGLPPVTIAVNVSANEFRDENFLQGLFVTLGETRLDPKFLVVELTEGLLMKHAEVAAAILLSLRQVGVQVAIDDFGTGYSSLGYLQKFPLDALKIDQSFVRQIDDPNEDTTIVTAVIALARSLKLRVIAEGVETRPELEFLRAHRCEEVQGYYFSRPVPPEQFARLLQTGIPEPDAPSPAPLILNPV